MTSALPTFQASSCSQIRVIDPKFDPRTLDGEQDIISLSHREEMLALYEYARRSSGTIIEIGTYCGYTAIGMAFGVKNRDREHERASQIFTIDTHRGVVERDAMKEDLAALRERGQPATFSHYVRQAKAHGVWDLLYPVIDDAAHAWKGWNREPAGMMFIDGDHVQAARDFHNWSRHLKKDATVCFHDYWEETPQVMTDVDLLVSEGLIKPIERIHTLFIARLLR